MLSNFNNNKNNTYLNEFWQNYPIIQHSSSNFYFQKTYLEKTILNSFVFMNNFAPGYDSFFFSSKIKSAVLMPFILPIQNKQSFYYPFFFLRRSSFIDFFVNNNIDTPNCFKKVKSVRRLNFELPLLKLINFLTKKGKREQLQVFFFKALMCLYVIEKKETKHLSNFFNTNQTNWLNTYLIFCNLFDAYDKKKQIGQISNNVVKLEINYKNFLTFFGKTISYSSYIKNALLKKLIFILPIFSFFIHNVDKNVKKFSRGKAGKYSFVWKYIANYRRLYVTLRLISKDVKFSSGRKLEERIKTTLSTVCLNPTKSFAWKSKIFSYNYIFKNYRKTLMRTLKTNK